MAMPAPDRTSLREIEQILDTGADVGHAWLAMCQAWARMFLRPLSALSYSAAAEAAELLRRRQGDGGPHTRHAAEG